jgi:hypothetical protein
MPRISQLIRSFSVAVAAAATMLLGAAAGQATAAVGDPGCPTPVLETPFAAWNDHAKYTLVPGGDFEAETTSWSLSGGAALRWEAPPEGTEDALAATHQRFLALPAGSSATSPEMCIGLEYPTLRFFARTTEPSSSRLAVHVVFRTPDGVSRRLRIAELAAGERWEPTRVILILANLLALHPEWDGKVAFRFTPTGGAADWSIDDVWVDPYER